MQPPQETTYKGIKRMDPIADAPAPAAVSDPAPQDAQSVTSEQLNQAMEKISGDVKAMLGRVPHLVQEQMQTAQPKQQEAPKQATGSDATSIDPKAEVARLLKEEREALASDRQQIERQRIRGSLEQELINNGANPQAVKLATDSLMMRNDGKLAIESNELGESSVRFRADEYSEGVSVGDFVRNFLTSDEGASVVQPKVSPSVRGIPNGSGKIVGEVIKMTRQEASTADPKVLLSGRVQFTD
jgi:hypothetical protein